MRVRLPHPIARLLLSLLFTVPLFSPSAAWSIQTSVPDKMPYLAPTAQTTLDIFPDRPMPDDLWLALVTALRAELSSGSPETRVLVGETTGRVIGLPADQTSDKGTSHPFQVVRGDKVAPDSLNVENSITVFLHGECTIIPRPRPILVVDTVAPTTGALGWVRREHGHIEPFAHVECSSLGEMLATQAFGLNRDERNRLMAVAMARVILHEWIHIATQNSHHSEHGLGKAQFGVADLLAHPARQAAQWGTRLRDEP